MSRASRWGVFLLAAFVGIAVYGYLARPGWMGVADKTLWDWMQLLIVPLLLAGGGFLLNSNIQQRHDELVEQAQREREEMAAIRRAQDDALRAYIDQMSRLIAEGRLYEDPKDSYLRRLAEASTLQTLVSLDKDRKRAPLTLIYELDLISKGNPFISLKNAGLDTADLSEITMREVSLREADLRLTNLTGADLKGSDLRGADLRGANLAGADLSDTVLTGANLLPYDETQPAKLNASSLSRGVDPSDIDLSNDHLKLTNLNDTDLSNADLSDAYLTGADLIGANLTGAELTGADLTGANLISAVGFTSAELEQQTASLNGATMPNGQKYEEWLKSREEDGDDYRM